MCFSTASSSRPKAVVVLLTFDAGMGLGGGQGVEEAAVVGPAVAGEDAEPDVMRVQMILVQRVPSNSGTPPFES